MLSSSSALWILLPACLQVPLKEMVDAIRVAKGAEKTIGAGLQPSS